MYNLPTIVPYEIIWIINAAWSKLFACIALNKKAVAGRGWFPYNQAMMINLKIQASIMDKEIELELSDTSHVIILSRTCNKILHLKNSTTLFNPRNITPPHHRPHHRNPQLPDQCCCVVS